MFVAYNVGSTIDDDDIAGFADPRTFPEAFTDLVMDGSVWRPNTLIDDDHRLPSEGVVNVESFFYVFYAKDKDTLKDGLKACPEAMKVSAGTRGQIGFFCGSYDFETFGAWSRNKSTAAKNWKSIQQQRRNGTGDHLAGLKQGRHETMVHRLRLKERGYFMLVCRGSQLPNVRNARKMIASEMALSGLGRMLSGRSPKMTPQQAVGALMDDLLIA